MAGWRFRNLNHVIQLYQTVASCTAHVNRFQIQRLVAVSAVNLGYYLVLFTINQEVIEPAGAIIKLQGLRNIVYRYT
jgi:hypothetical protein